MTLRWLVIEVPMLWTSRLSREMLLWKLCVFNTTSRRSKNQEEKEKNLITCERIEAQKNFRDACECTKKQKKRFNCCSRNKSMNSSQSQSACIDKENKRKMKHVNWCFFDIKANCKKWKSTKKWVVRLTICFLHLHFWIFVWFARFERSRASIPGRV